MVGNMFVVSVREARVTVYVFSSKRTVGSGSTCSVMYQALIKEFANWRETTQP